MISDFFWETTIRDVVTPPSQEPTWQWIEQHVRIPPGSALPGPVDFALLPCPKAFISHCDNVQTRSCTALVSAQSTKTESVIQMILSRIVRKPVTTMWVMASAESCEEFAKKRLWQAVELCDQTRPLLPKAREEWTKQLAQFKTMNLILRGSNSRVGLQSDPVGLIICDERREWKKGAIELLRKRTLTFPGSLEISVGVAGFKDDEHHRDFENGSQTFFHWDCPHCGHAQPFRFGRKESVLFPQARECGGMVWDENETTRPGGVWNFDEVLKTVAYECENIQCRARFKTADKARLLRTVKEFHRNPKAMPERISLHWNVMYMPWAKASFEAVVREFLMANDALKVGDINPLMAFVQETLGEPWEIRANAIKAADIVERFGGYKMGTMWMDPSEPLRRERNTAQFLTIDRQLGYLVAVHRQWRKNGQSRLIFAGRFSGDEDVRAYQLAHKIAGPCVGMDEAFETSKARKLAAQYGWILLRGDDKIAATWIEGKSVKRPFRKADVDPGIGTAARGGILTVPVYFWENDYYKEKLYSNALRGLGPRWEIADDAPEDYLKEITAEELREERNSDNTIEWVWHRKGPNHSGDCECMQQVMAEIYEIGRLQPRPKEPEPVAPA